MASFPADSTAMTPPDRARLEPAAACELLQMRRRVMSDQLTPVLAYRRLVAPDERTAPSFLLESVEGGAAVGRYSYLAARPSLEVMARATTVTVTDHGRGTTQTTVEADPLALLRRLGRRFPLPSPGGATGPRFTGGWVGYVGYDAVRYLEPVKLPFPQAPPDDRGLPDLHMGLYREVVVFDHAQKLVHVICHEPLDEHGTEAAAREHGADRLDDLVRRLLTPGRVLPAGTIDMDPAALPAAPGRSTFTRPRFEAAVERCRRYIAAGDAFQIVLSQRFERRTRADPFEVYRALRIVNPSPYMIYLQATGAILVGASPEILCRVDGGLVTTRPLAGTRPRGLSPQEDAALERQLREDAKERAEHVMLVDLGRNDLGRVCREGSIRLERLMEVERYSHVMHLASTVSGELRDGLDAWDALRATLPVGTVSGAPKVRAMQIIDELEPVRRGPYAGAIGVVGFGGEMDMAIALRTMVIPTAGRSGGDWVVHLQAGAGIVADSVPAHEYDETVRKAAALGRAIDLAESVFPGRSPA
jgi:anthranilate synthase component 1